MIMNSLPRIKMFKQLDPYTSIYKITKLIILFISLYYIIFYRIGFPLRGFTSTIDQEKDQKDIVKKWNEELYNYIAKD